MLDTNLSCVYTPVETSAYSEGKIVSQSRRVGSTITKGSSLTVEYAAKPTKKNNSSTASPSASTSPSPSASSSTDAE